MSLKKTATADVLDREEAATPVEHTRAAQTSPARHRVVVVGGGFAGLRYVRKLARAPADVTPIDRRNVHLFQPLAYHVATGSSRIITTIGPSRPAGVFRQASSSRS